MKRLFVLAIALCLVMAGVAVASVLSSKHDMRLEDTANQGAATAVCEFCHHPHRGVSADGITNALIWNKKYTTGAVYAPYADTATLTATPGTVSLSNDFNTNGFYATALCMSCHDGANASNGIVRGVRQASGSDSTQLTITYDIAAADLGSTFEDDHPVNFSYVDDSGDDVPGTNAGGPTGVKFNTTTNTYPLYDAYFQCATCHDVHAGDNSKSQYVQFMRGNTVDSEICRECHTAK